MARKHSMLLRLPFLRNGLVFGSYEEHHFLCESAALEDKIIGFFVQELEH